MDLLTFLLVGLRWIGNFIQNKMFDGGKVILTDICAAKKKADDLAQAGPSISRENTDTRKVLPRVTEVAGGKFPLALL